MADNYKILAQDVAVSIEQNSNQNQANIIYTVPENTQAAISSISLVNSSSTNEDYYLGAVKAEDVDSSAEFFGSVARITVAGSEGNNYRSYSSTDGISWQPTSISNGPVSVLSGSFGNGVFVFSGYNSSYVAGLGISSDGVSYTFTQFSEIFESLVSNGAEIPRGGVTFHGTKFFLTITLYDGSQPSGSQYTYPVYTSEDALLWTPFEINGLDPFIAEPELKSVGEKLFLTTNFAENGYVQSDYGIAVFDSETSSWSRILIPLNTLYGFSFNLANSDGTYVLFGDNQSDWYFTSTDLVSWTLRSLPAGSSSFYARALEAYGPYVYVSGYTSSTLLRSSNVLDGSSWENLTDVLPAVAFGYFPKFFSFEEKIFAKYRAAWPNNSTYAYSSNYGDTWTLGELPDSVSFSAILKKSDTISTVLSLSTAQTIIPNRSIAPNAVDEISGGITLSAGDQIRVYSESPDLIVQVYGVEIS